MNTGEIMEMEEDAQRELRAIQERLDQVGSNITDVWGQAEQLLHAMPQNEAAQEAVGLMAELDSTIDEAKRLAAQAAEKFAEM